MTQDPGENDNEYRSKAWVGKSYAIKHRGRDWHRTQLGQVPYAFGTELEDTDEVKDESRTKVSFGSGKWSAKIRNPNKEGRSYGKGLQ
jgi:hypothetical protein